MDSLGEIKVNVDDFKCPLSMSNLDERKMCEQFAAMAAIRESFKTRMDAPALLRIHVSFVPLLGNSKLYNDAVDFYRIEMNNMLTTMKERFGESKVMALSYVTKEDPSSVEHRRLRRATDTKEVSGHKHIAYCCSELIYFLLRRIRISIWPESTMTIIPSSSISSFGSVLFSSFLCTPLAMPLPPWIRAEIQSSIVWHPHESRKTTKCAYSK